MNLNGFLNDSEKIIDSTPVYENKNSSQKLKRTKSKMILTDKHLYIDINIRDYLLKLRRILKINYIEANKSQIKIFESIDNDTITNKSTVFFEFSNNLLLPGVIISSLNESVSKKLSKKLLS